MRRLGALFACLALPAQAADFEFCWIGNDGFALSGQMTVPDTALSQPIVTETDITAFAISGSQNGAHLGAWSLTDLTPTTSWNLNFDPTSMAFVTGGYSDTPNGQQWNASGSVDNCGTPGFGFNSGGGGQDVCVDNTYRTESIIDASTPFPVYSLGEGPACSAAPLFSNVAPHTHSAS